MCTCAANDGLCPSFNTRQAHVHSVEFYQLVVLHLSVNHCLDVNYCLIHQTHTSSSETYCSASVHTYIVVRSMCELIMCSRLSVQTLDAIAVSWNQIGLT